jgi:hypothetical protein
MPNTSMICDTKPDMAHKSCKTNGCNQRAKSKKCDLCVDCCIQRNCKKAGPDNIDIVCEPHNKINKSRIEKNKASM